MFKESEINPEKRSPKIFENEKCKILSEIKGNTIIETIDYNEEELQILGFLMEDIESGKDVGYATFSSREKDRALIDINHLKTKYITEMQESFPESTRKALNNNSDILAAIKIYPEFRGEGFAKILFEYAMEYLSKKGFKELYVSSDVTAMDNPDEKSFYEKIGVSTKREGSNVTIDLEKWYQNYLENKK